MKQSYTGSAKGNKVLIPLDAVKWYCVDVAQTWCAKWSPPASGASGKEGVGISKSVRCGMVNNVGEAEKNKDKCVQELCPKGFVG